MRNQVTDTNRIADFIYGGRSTFTLVSPSTGNRFTYRVSRADGDEDDRPYFVNVLTGSDNENDYRYAGCIFPNRPEVIKQGRKGMDSTATSVKAIAWYLYQLEHNADNAGKVDFWHEGKCAACGRKLTVPRSIETGFGPVCAGRM